MDSDQMVSEQIKCTLEFLSKVEASMTAELLGREMRAKVKTKRIRSAGNSSTRNSNFLDQVRLDSTMVTEIECLNMLPADLSRY